MKGRIARDCLVKLPTKLHCGNKGYSVNAWAVKGKQRVDS